jgi:hypothetical protein
VYWAGIVRRSHGIKNPSILVIMGSYINKRQVVSKDNMGLWWIIVAKAVEDYVNTSFNISPHRINVITHRLT